MSTTAAGPGRRATRGRALPPTIKQRIRAEAHGTSPAVRRATAGAGTPSRGATAPRAATATPRSATAPSVASRPV
ncbi:DUF6344 domain-containing protein [Streptomyces sp. TRM49041]|uniref:DUF6344 domain-containing protein n=1 Tax=Streptomyces sp. TRM49041 TaxID=2603216 RepID=UPI0037DA2B6A